MVTLLRLKPLFLAVSLLCIMRSALAQDGPSPAKQINGPVDNEPPVIITARDPGVTVTSNDSDSHANNYNGVITHTVTNLPKVSVTAYVSNNQTPTTKTAYNKNGGDDVLGEPVQLSTGTKIDASTDIALPGEMGLKYERYYHSNDGISPWTDNFDYTLNDTCPNGDGNPNHCHQTTIYRPDGSTLAFNGGPGDATHTEIGGNGVATLAHNADGTYTLHDEDAMTEVYNGAANGAGGTIKSITDASGVGWTFTYNVSPPTTPSPGTTAFSTTVTVTHTNGQSITRTTAGTYTPSSPQGHTFTGTTTVTDPAGNVFTYTGNSLSVINTVTLPGSPTTVITYHYLSNSALMNEMDYNGVPYAYTTYGNLSAYGSVGSVSGTSMADGSQPYTFAYVMGNPVNGSGPVTVTAVNSFGHSTVNTYGDGASIAGGANQLLSVSDSAVADGPATTHTRAYDPNGYLTKTVDNNGNVHTYNYAATGQLQTETEASGTPLARTTDYQWDPNLQLNRVLSVTVEGWSKTTYTYNTQNRLATVAVTNLSSHGTTGQTLTTTYGYTLYPNGMVQTMTVAHPSPNNSNTDTYSYDALGNLTSYANGLGHTTTYSNYNALGEVGQITGPNGDTTNYTYDARARVSTKTTHPNGTTATWTHTYDGFGLPAKIVSPDGQTIAWTRNAEMQVTTITHNDKDGASTESFTYDINGDVTGDVVTRGSNVSLSRSVSYDALGRMYQTQGMHGQATTYGYDGKGHISSLIDALGDATLTQYDALDRVTQITRTTATPPVVVPPPPPESTPPVLTAPATSTTGNYTVSWNAIQGASSYTLQQQVNGGSWNTIQNSAATSWSVSGQANGTYDYQAQACTTGGCGPWSSVVTTTVDSATSAPSPIPTLDGASFSAAYAIPDTKFGEVNIGFEVTNGTWEVFNTVPPSESNPSGTTNMRSGTVPVGAVTVQYTWTSVGVPSGDVDAGGAITNNATTPTPISSNPGTQYGTPSVNDHSGSRGHTYTLTIDFYDAVGNHISHSTCTLTAETEGSV